MSADNWTKCPKCVASHEAERVKNIDKVNKSYGKVSAEEYRRAFDAANVENSDPDSLREDCEIGVHENYFEVDYRCSCSVCGFSFKFKEEKKIV